MKDPKEPSIPRSIVERRRRSILADYLIKTATHGLRNVGDAQ
ncbi:unnamed protein product, partial [Rotaria sp. Silwood2]